ncbi:DIS3-like exonuclease 2 isoform X1 [Camponotus floridanus]|uniref:DIS3-like exonuclease 2 isoform X1 n=1 Tax=Camponotus floridanus TaxID=104421 RepID=UPI000DC69443|nr:DIS3-like exonuclease 2 isoform X1 [Camponotus floridanus]
MPRYSTLKADKVKKERLSFHCKKRIIALYKNKQKYSVQKTVSDSLKDGIFVTLNDELVELTAQFADKFKVSPNIQMMTWKRTKNHKILTSEKVQDALNFSQDNTKDFIQHGDVSQISLNPKLKIVKTTNRLNIAQSKNTSMKDKRKDNSTLMSTDNELKTKNHLIINQANIRDKLKCWKKNKMEKSIMNPVINESSMDNVSKEYCQDKESCKSKEIIKNNTVKGRKNAQKMVKTKQIFSDYISVSKMKKILKKQTSDNVQYVKGNLRVNPTSSKYAYLRMENEGERDLLIIGTYNRNRAFDGDLVVAHINPEKYWHKFPDGQIQKTGKVICILEKVHSRRAIGCLRKKDSFMLLYPKDQRIPLVVPESIPVLYHSQPDLYKNVMFLVSIDSWEQIYASGRILSVVGKVGEIEAELQAIILEHNLDVLPYREELLEELPGSDYILTDDDMKDREDWRHECVFTIDPATAIDLDDAISCKVLDNGNYEVGVHISDVTHYLKFSSPLDMEVSKRATSIYLPHTTYHMLPEKLCQICSLSAGKDRLAFSVIWEMTSDAEIVKHHFAKTIIRSCCQLSYDMAQAMIENPEKTQFQNSLNIKGNYTVSSLSNVVNNLFKLSNQLRNKRFDNGALRLDQPKLQICTDTTLSQEQGIPIPVNYHLEERKDSNSLVEEFMLLANVTVATKLYTAIPEMALLRIHKDPSKYSLNTVCDTLRKYGIHLNGETAKSLQASIRHYDPEYNAISVNNSMKYIMTVIINLCSKTMMRAEYICSSTISSLQDLRHYALNVPLYTHFTSPIRRYSDCVVHRLLHAAIENKSLSEKWTTKLCSKIAANCNAKKYSAKLVQEQSTELFFAHMVGLADGFDASAIVLYVKEEGIEVILCDIGIKLRVDLKEIEHTATVKYLMEYVPTIIVSWKEQSSTAQVINLFSLVHVRVEKIKEELRLKATLLPPL